MNQRYDPTDLRAQDAAGAKQAQEQLIMSQQQAGDLKWLMSDPRGRRFMWELLGQTGLYRTSFTGNSTTFFLEGQRQIGLYLMGNLLEHCPKRHTEMTEEQNK